MSKSPQKDTTTVIDVLPKHSATDDPRFPEIDSSLLRDSLAKTPWERMQANDDALNFAEALRASMEKRRA